MIGSIRIYFDCSRFVGVKRIPRGDVIVGLLMLLTCGKVEVS